MRGFSQAPYLQIIYILGRSYVGILSIYLGKYTYCSLLQRVMFSLTRKGYFSNLLAEKLGSWMGF